MSYCFDVQLDRFFIDDITWSDTKLNRSGSFVNIY